MRRKLLLLTIVMGNFFTGFAQSTNDVVVWKSDGSIFTCSLSDRPKITYADKYYTIAAGDSKTVLLFTDVWKIMFYEDMSSEIKNGLAARPNISFSHDKVTITGAKNDELIAVYSISGKLLQKVKANSTGQAQISISSLPNGIYIINTTFSSLKFTKK